MPFTIHPNSPNQEAIPLVSSTFTEIEPQLRSLLPELPQDLEIYVYDDAIIPEHGVGGFAYSPKVLSISVDNDFPDKAFQKKNIASTTFHEAYHLVQGHTGNDGFAEYTNALDSAVYEGCAVIFEREYRDASVPFGDYSHTDEALLEEWSNALAEITQDEWMAENSKLWEQWSFYDAEDQQRWKAYKIGTWIVDKYIQSTGSDIRDMRTLSAQQIINSV